MGVFQAALLIAGGVATAYQEAGSSAREARKVAIVQHIAFGSCADQNKPQPIWDSIVRVDPDVFVLLGDNIYADTVDMAKMRADYARLGAIEGFRKLKAHCPLLATWDDHDYGKNDAGADYSMKQASQQAFLDFFGVPADSPRRSREGIYHAEVFGPPGRRVQFILLDTRYHRGPLVPRVDRSEPGDGRGGRYGPNRDPGATILGYAQWEWLREQLRVPAEVRIIASSIQVIPVSHGYEKWANFPLERSRLFQLIRETGANGVMFISGDRHAAEISRLSEGVPYPLYEVTSSSLNRPRPWVNELNEHRVGLMYFGANFGLIRIQWDLPDPVINLEIRDDRGEVVIRHDTALSVLRGRREPMD